MAGEPHLRVSDQDREQAASAIREHYAAGRLDSAEFEERVQAAYSARTQSELNALSADLPPLPPKPPSTTELIRRSVTANYPLVGNAAAGVGVFAACTGIWALTGAGSSFWPKWVLVLTLVSIARGLRREARRARRGRGGRGGRSGGHGWSYRYEYRYGDGRHEHTHEHR